MNDAIAYFSLSNLDAVVISAGYPFRGSIDGLPQGNCGVIQMANIDVEGAIDWESITRVTLPSTRSVDYLQPGDVILSTRGTRNLAVALEEPPFPTVCSPQFFVLRVNRPDGLLPSFLAWQINQRPAQEYFHREATGSYILNIRREVVESLPLAVPPLQHQRRIVDLAAAAREEREVLARLINIRNQQMEAIAMDLHRPERLIR